jgi:hypothetical protein
MRLDRSVIVAEDHHLLALLWPSYQLRHLCRTNQYRIRFCRIRQNLQRQGLKIVGIVSEFFLVNDGNRRGLDTLAVGSGAHTSP